MHFTSYKDPTFRKKKREAPVLYVAGLVITKRSKFYVTVVPMLLKHLDFLFSFGLQVGRNMVVLRHGQSTLKHRNDHLRIMAFDFQPVSTGIIGHKIQKVKTSQLVRQICPQS